MKQSPRTLQRELAGSKSFKLLQSLWRLLHSTTHHALMEEIQADHKSTDNQCVLVYPDLSAVYVQFTSDTLGK